MKKRTLAKMPKLCSAWAEPGHIAQGAEAQAVANASEAMASADL
jgi:hypothetical protein